MTVLANDARQRLGQLLGALERCVAPGSRAREALIERLLATTGLSRRGIEWALDHCLERAPTERELAALLERTVPAKRAHVIAPASVFVAGFRALALALAAAPVVFVKPSRRDPALIEALGEAAPGLFRVVARLEPQPEDHVFAFGSDQTLEALRGALPPGAVLHAHGSGFGVVAVELDRKLADGEPTPDELARCIALDVAVFEQRGCLSPRLVLAIGDADRISEFAERLAVELEQVEAQLPFGRLDAVERAEVTWYQHCAACFGRVLRAGSGAISLRDSAEPVWLEAGAAALEIPPAGRQLEVLAVGALEPALLSLRPWLTTVGCSSAALRERLTPLLDPIRVTLAGRMQRPELDGPVDRRPDPRGEVIGG